MKDFSGARILVTGGASGIGFGLANALVEQGASSVVIADIEQSAIDDAVAEMRVNTSAEVIGVHTDVTDLDSNEALAETAWSAFGAIDVVCLNAGVFAAGHVWETTEDDWDWVFGVNLRGVVNGVRAFVPRLIEKDSPSHVIVTASLAGVIAAPVSGVYCTSKFAALGLAESLHHDLELVGADQVSVSALCPGMVSTNIGEGHRNRPADLPDATVGPNVKMALDGIQDAMDRGLGNVEAGRNAIGQVMDGRFYVSTHPVEVWNRLVGVANDDRLAGRAPQFQILE